MARKHLIHYHTSGTELPGANGGDGIRLGEIAVQHASGSEGAKLIIATVTGDTDTARFAEFIPKTDIEALISAATSGLTTDVQELQGIVSGYTGAGSIKTAVDAVSSALNDEVTARTADTKSITDKLGTGFTAENTVRKEINDLSDKIGTGFTTSSVTEVTNSLNTRLGVAEGKITDLEEQVSALTTGSLTEITANNTDSEYIDVFVSDKGEGTTQSVGASAKTVSLANASADTDGLAIAYDVKQEIDSRLGTGVTSSSSATQQFANINTAITQINSDISNINDKVGDGFEASSLTEEIVAVKATAGSALRAISAGTSDNYITVTIGAKDANKEQTVAVSAKTVSIANASADTDGLAVAYDVKNYFTAGTSALTNDVSDLKLQLNGINKEDSGVTKYIDSKLSAVYTYKGSCTYDELTAKTSGNVVGDVYNVTTSAQTSTHIYPAGTNWAWAKDEGETGSGHWDPLAGSIDTSVFMLVSAFDDWTANTYNPQITAITSGISALQTSVSNIGDTIGTGFTPTDGETVTDKLAAVKTTADAAVQGVSVKNTDVNLITATEDDTTHDVEFDFDNMIVDCGTY